MKPQATKSDPPDSPAMIKEGHVQDRFLHKSDITPSAWSRLSIFQRASRAGKLVDKERCKGNTKAEVEENTKAEVQRAIDRNEAGTQLEKGWLIVNAGNWALGSDMNKVRVVGCPGSFADHQIDVKNHMRALEKNLGTRDWMILRRVCRENVPIAEAVTEITPGYRASTLARFRESLDALVEAMAQLPRVVINE